jgi:hypothetical protein
MGSTKRADAGLEQARQAKDQLQRKLAACESLRGIGITRVGQAYAVKVNLSNAADRESVPDAVKGVQVVVAVVGEIRKRGAAE